jgi:hypothetical protein
MQKSTEWTFCFKHVQVSGALTVLARDPNDVAMPVDVKVARAVHALYAIATNALAEE